MNDFVLLDKRNGVVILTLNRPQERNGIGSHESCEQLATAIRQANSDPEAGCLIITGAGSAFCAGANVKKILSTDGITRRATPAATRENYKNGIQQIPLALWECEIPTIAAVNGPAIGAGCDLACMCDIRIASEQARFAESFLKLGLVPGDGGAWFLPRIVGASKAAELTFTGDAVDAAEARAIGLVSRVVSASDLLPVSIALAERIAAQPRDALRLSKRLLRESERSRLPEFLELSAAFQALAHESPDHVEAVTAFIEKRPPRFSGR
jgi:2-(1,2-epoxy-1,2-dihydrophenyl)acetyl-CoA isomerase